MQVAPQGGFIVRMGMLFQWGEGDGNEDGTISAKPSLRGHSLLPMEGGAPKGRRLDGGSGMKKIGEDRLKYAVCESILSTAARSPFPNGEGCETRIPLSPFCRIF